MFVHTYIMSMNKSFQQCISDICGLELSSVTDGKYSVFGNSVAVVEGHRGIAEYGVDRVTFLLGKGVLEVCGHELKIKCLEKHYSVITGKIISVSVKNV